MPELSLIHRIRRGEWVDHILKIAQILVAIVALLGIAGWLTLNPFLLLSFIFSQPLIVLALILFIVAAIFFQRAVVLERFDAGEVIYERGTHPRFVYLIKSGEVDAVLKFANGKEQTIASFGPGRYLGFAALAEHIPHKFTARARTAAQILRIRPSDFVSLFADIPELIKEIEDAIDKYAPELKGTSPKFKCD